MSKFTFKGKIEAVGVQCTAPAPFDKVGEDETTWSLTYTFGTGTTDVDGSAEAGQYRNAVTEMELKIDGPGVSERVSGSPGEALPGGFSSVIAVNNHPNRVQSGFADYTAQVGLPNPDPPADPDPTAWAQVLLYEKDPPFGGTSLPLTLPRPFKKEFPRRAFILREAGSTRVCLLGTVTSFHS